MKSFSFRLFRRSDYTYLGTIVLRAVNAEDAESLLFACVDQRFVSYDPF